MNATYAYSIGPGMTAWQDHEPVLREGAYAWVDAGSNHLWAPDCNRRGDTYYLYVPDVAGKNSLDSRIGVSTGKSPTGPFTFQRTLDISGYASDPSTFVDDDDKAYLVFANGDYGTCGGLSIARLNDDMVTLATAPAEVDIAGIPTTGGRCGGGHVYLEGPQLDRFGAEGKDRYFLYFAMKPDDQNSVIAYATATAPLGPYTYRGVIMNGSAGEWTNQASIVRWGASWLFFYHDSSTQPPQRHVRAECLRFGADGTIQPIARTAAGLSSCAVP
jgi:beta-xylosidase